ncbi:halo transducer protein [Halorubrum distributum]|uniref:Halo transducer protein n=1 Tax=Halorubrum distributum TaxID=29283 RepID=A0A6B1IDS0_9EURY|nr:halo transducer protein [Halorubrum terrestre]MYL16949.1 halo transducer protein [Halorubrum terrestre]MYL66903.1 halo transducer protein [Halorubrum terrestre]
MTETASDGGSTNLDGMSTERAAELVNDDERDLGERRETLAIVTRDGTVRRAAVDDALANASKVVTTAETRVELAAEKLDGARETASPVADLDLVSTRLGDFDARLDAVEDRSDALGEAVQEVLAMRAEGDLYEVARRIRRLTTAATEVQRAADDLQFELGSFEEWLTDPDRRAAELDGDVDALAESIEELDEVSEALGGDGSGPEGEAGRTWAAARVRHRVASLLIADLRAELAALRRWAEREGAPAPSGIEPQIDEVQGRHGAVGDRLASQADPEWVARFGDRLTALDEALAAMEPPVAWGEVEAVVAEHRPEAE